MNIESPQVPDKDPKDAYKEKRSQGRVASSMSGQTNPNRRDWLQKMRAQQNKQEPQGPESNFH